MSTRTTEVTLADGEVVTVRELTVADARKWAKDYDAIVAQQRERDAIRKDNDIKRAMAEERRRQLLPPEPGDDAIPDEDIPSVSENFDRIYVGEIWLDDLARMTDKTAEEFEHYGGGDLDAIIAAAKELNARFFAIAGR